MSIGTTCQVAFFRAEVIFSISDVLEHFKSISRFPANFKEISLIFDLSRDQTLHNRAKISRFQNMLGFTQYGLRLFSIDASSDPSKFCDD